MKTKLIDEEIFYDGSQLKSLFAYIKFGLRGDSCVAWIGGCDVSLDHMIDGEDLRAGEKISSQKMVHFILEKFHVDLFSGVALQRLMATIVRDVLFADTKVAERLAKDKNTIRRDGDDLFLVDKKLSISIATQSPVSTLVHFAVNVTTVGTPVPTLSLEDLGVAPFDFAKAVLEKISTEVVSMVAATEKVRPTTSH